MLREAPLDGTRLDPAQANRTAAGRLAVDIGGTFTDIVAEMNDRQWTAKVPTVPGAPEVGVLNGIELALKISGLKPSAIGLFVHGTTLATNAVIERKGARTALLTTAGFRDTIELGTESRFDQYDVNIRKPAALIPRDLRIPVIERVAADGTIIKALDELSVNNAISAIRASNVESVAICFLHSYANAIHERRVRDLLKIALPELSISISSEVSPEMREYERATTTCVNAYVQPLIAGYLERLEHQLSARGFSAELLLMLSNGGLTTRAIASAFPVRLLESGPAGGAIYAQAAAKALAADRVLSFDMGGTTAKVCLIDDYQPQMSRLFEVDRSARFKKGSGMPVRIPVIDMVEIGAGGGSIARIDRLKRIHIGPDSAGSDPGPVSFDRGGTRPTVTDADLVLGRIDVSSFAGGQIVLNEPAARTALAAVPAEGGLNLDAQSFAFAVAEMVDESMSNAARVHAVESGRTLSERTMVAFGGAAPLHAARVADKCGISTVVIPRGAGVGSAVGFLLAPVSYEVTRSRYTRLGNFDPSPLNDLLATMSAEAHAVVRQAAVADAMHEVRTAFARYLGQGHEIAVCMPVRSLEAADAVALRDAFETAYLKLYGRLIEGIDIEILGWTVTVGIKRAEQVLPPAALQSSIAAPSGWREVFDVSSGRPVQTAIYLRDELMPGMRLSGPAIIAEASTSTVVSPAFDARIDPHGAIIMTRRVQS